MTMFFDTQQQRLVFLKAEALIFSPSRGEGEGGKGDEGGGGRGKRKGGEGG